MAGYDAGEGGILFKVKRDGTVLISHYVLSTSYETQTRIQPLIEKIAPKVREYFEKLLKEEIAKETRIV